MERATVLRNVTRELKDPRTGGQNQEWGRLSRGGSYIPIIPGLEFTG